MTACLRPSSLELPPWDDAQTSIVVARLADGGYAPTVLVVAPGEPPPLSLPDGTLYVLHYPQTPAALGVVEGFVLNESGEVGPAPARVYQRDADAWRLIIGEPPPELTLRIFRPPNACDRVVAKDRAEVLGSLRLLAGVDISGQRRLLIDRAGGIYRLEADDRLVPLGALGRPALAIATDDDGTTVLILDQDGRLDRWDVATGSAAIVVPDAAGLELTPGTFPSVASLLAPSPGEIHVALTATPTIAHPTELLAHRTAVAAGGRWQRWQPRGCTFEASQGTTQSARLAVATNGDVISIGECRDALFRHAASGEVSEEVLPGIGVGTPFVVRTIRGQIHVGTRSGQIYTEPLGPRLDWVARVDLGSGTVDDIAPLGGDGLLVAIRFEGSPTGIKAWFPSVGTIGHCARPADANYPGLTIDLVQRGDHYLATAIQPDATVRLPIGVTTGE